MDTKTKKAELVALYLTAVEAAIERHPALEWTRKTCAEWAAGALLGRTRRMVRSKGRFTDIPRGSFVLYAEDGSDVALWSSTGSNGEVRTLVSASHVVTL